MEYSRVQAPNKKKYLAAFAALGVVAIVGVVAMVGSNPENSTQSLFTAQGSQEYEVMFSSWTKHFKVNYANYGEYLRRFKTFSDNVRYIEKHNQNGNTYTLGINQFADLTKEQFSAQFHGFNREKDQNRARKEVYLSTVNLPDTVDWSEKGAVTAIKNQGQCGSCWAFSTTGSIEGLHFQKTGTLTSFSEQQLVDCSGSYGNQGCNGGLMDDAFQYVEKYGLEIESAYPYTAEDGSCQYDASRAEFKITGYHDVPQENNLQLKAAAAQQPVSVAIEADQSAFQFYSGGVLTGDCGTSLDHGVLIVGYGTSNGTKYWKVKNSWGASWGESGYVRIERTDDTSSGKCGIALSASYPTA